MRRSGCLGPGDAEHLMTLVASMSPAAAAQATDSIFATLFKNGYPRVKMQDGDIDTLSATASEQ